MGRDLRRYARITQARLIVGAVALTLTVGAGLIWWVYGPQAAALGAICILAGVVPSLLILIGLLAFEWIVRRANRD
jgi:hypothetical protein